MAGNIPHSFSIAWLDVSLAGSEGSVQESDYSRIGSFDKRLHIGLESMEPLLGCYSFRKVDLAKQLDSKNQFGFDAPCTRSGTGNRSR